MQSYTKNNYVTRVYTEDDFFRYLVRSPRNYSIVLLFNSDRDCFACREVDNHFEKVAIAYSEQSNNFIGTNKTTFFMRIPIESMYGVNQKMGITTAPAILYVPPVKGTGFPHKDHQKLYYPSAKYEMIPFEITEFLNSKGIEVIKLFIIYH